MIKNITRDHILKAISKIDNEVIPANRRSTKYNLVFNNKTYPPKYVISIANIFVKGKELQSSKFNGGSETNNYLISLGFDIQTSIKGGNND
ncbi:hypothetical protein PM10SUCC1_14730 [Propionigenium maris DSM 9537]|uniref:ScoMcrA-like N-terminal head domain-containing protein n=1 Tax=Propionigenium maris DSM 9537 TaxID=1123000 RepID=A0A9W6GIT0_9FUSO|nr:hypothetical protein [Propionigenium maris]GLI55959.1 hypothetical protein PM10SUCC1_14730 [Propionigenium maris DSM 9537]